MQISSCRGMQGLGIYRGGNHAETAELESLVNGR